MISYFVCARVPRLISWVHLLAELIVAIVENKKWIAITKETVQSKDSSSVSKFFICALHPGKLPSLCNRAELFISMTYCAKNWYWYSTHHVARGCCETCDSISTTVSSKTRKPRFRHSDDNTQEPRSISASVTRHLHKLSLSPAIIATLCTFESDSPVSPQDSYLCCCSTTLTASCTIGAYQY